MIDCRAAVKPSPPPRVDEQSIVADYMAKDYDSLLRAMLDLLPERVPGWKDRTEADLGMAILELFAYIGDQLSYYQDRIAQEGFLRTATQYDSVRKLLSLIDYRPFPGSAARVLLALQTTARKYLPKGFQVRTSGPLDAGVVAFETDESRVLFPELNSIALSVAAPASVDGDMIVLAAELDESFLPVGTWLFLRDETRQEWAQIDQPVVVDAILHTTSVRFVSPLRNSYPPGAIVFGNAVWASHGSTNIVKTRGTGLPGQTLTLERAPLTYTMDDNGESTSSLSVEVDNEVWVEVEDFIDSGPADPHFRCSRDNDGFVTIHFGDGHKGRTPPAPVPITLADSLPSYNVVVRYRVGIGEAGIVAADSLTRFDDPDRLIDAVTNPVPSQGGKNPESMAQAKLFGPHQLSVQNRAVLPEDYEAVVLRGATVAHQMVMPLHAKATFEWTGSWTSVVVSVDLPGRHPFDQTPGLRAAFEAALDAKRMSGLDVQVVDARYAPLHISVVVNVKPDFFARHVRQQVQDTLCLERLPDGTVGFFAQKHSTFGQSVFLSDLYATLMGVEGVESVKVARFKRFGDRYPDRTTEGFIPVDPLEIVRCDSDPRRPENGFVNIRTCGGKEG
jgi:hypothetical protein